ncbi:hypothetical protein FE257_006663 [Aspergillus nanangensis]|uniref:Zn(2)-C6 fungal-type domain-containing protein n=1 Tax=Aspergillus nanangensis TaxID=2582783 RepID=A0AAD4CQJ6_ASPNN|nr:hypothetical protein FE257_006663 [Aspergillus nanangensis]
MPQSQKRKAVDPDEQQQQQPTPTFGNPLYYPRRRVALACEVCRLRKTRCDATKPSCSLCKELEIECVYRRPNADAKDNDRTTDLGISAVVQRLDKIESTLDLLATQGYRQGTCDALAQGGPPSCQNEYASTSPASLSQMTAERYACKMPNLLLFKSPGPDQDSYAYDVASAFYRDQAATIVDMKIALRLPLVDMDLARPYLWELQRSFAESVLKWLPLFDSETATRHLQAARISGYTEYTTSTCLSLLIFAVGAITADAAVCTASSQQLPGFSYYSRALAMLDTFPSPGDGLSVLQCHVLAGAYLLFAIRPLQAWKTISQASQDCIILLKTTDLDTEPVNLRESFSRIFWICYVLEHELEVCLELPPSGLRGYDTIVPLPTSGYEEDGLYYLLAVASLRKLMMEVVDTVGLNSKSAVQYAPLVALELRNQIEDWYQHLPASLRFPKGHFYLFDARRAHLRCQYYALIAVVTWPFVLKCNNLPCHPTTAGEDDPFTKGANQCLRACLQYVQAAEEILTHKSLESHLVIRGFFATTMILMLVFPGSETLMEISSVHRDLLAQAFKNLTYWKAVPFMHWPLMEMERIAHLKGILA